ncbi:MAG: GNAT family N-acetyltransferase [Chloroflexi bacterium]|nr:GNAT family N-acetyltransferase [Chloroflexota bacterium]
MEIRPANLSDLNTCIAVDDSFETDFVWQMEERTGPTDVNVSFRLARLPRPMKVTGVVSGDDVLFNFQHGGVLFVADEGGIKGFIDVSATGWNQMAYVNNLAVAPGFRRKGVGTRLMRAALDWARQKKLRAVMLDTSTKDYPAICFYQKHGFAFCGFNDQLYPNRDIALLFSLTLR